MDHSCFTLLSAGFAGALVVCTIINFQDGHWGLGCWTAALVVVNLLIATGHLTTT